jgi:hypothetical protein
MACSCIGEIDETLKPYGHALVTTMFGEPKVCIETYRERKGAKKPPKVLASFCPFCGAKYGWTAREDATVAQAPKAEA